LEAVAERVRLQHFSSVKPGSSGREVAEREHDGEGTLFTFANAVKNGAEIFRSYSEGLQ